MSIRFSTWTSQVNWHCKRALFTPLDEMPDVDLFSLYQAGLTPMQAFTELCATTWFDEAQAFEMDRDSVSPLSYTAWRFQ